MNDWWNRVSAAWNDPDDNTGDRLRRALSGRPTLPPEVLEAKRRFEEDREEHDAELQAGDEYALERHMRLMAQYTEAEHRAGIHTSCGHDLRAKRDSPTTREQVDEPTTPPTVWGLVNPDGSVTAKGFTSDEGYAEDVEVHPPDRHAVYHEGGDGYPPGWYHAATGRPVTPNPAARPIIGKDPDPPRIARSPTNTPSPAGAGTGGGAMSDASEGNAKLKQCADDCDTLQQTAQQAKGQAEAISNQYQAAMEGSQQQGAEEGQQAIALIADAADALLQAAGNAKSAIEGIHL